MMPHGDFVDEAFSCNFYFTVRSTKGRNRSSGSVVQCWFCS